MGHSGSHASTFLSLNSFSVTHCSFGFFFLCYVRSGLNDLIVSLGWLFRMTGYVIYKVYYIILNTASHFLMVSIIYSPARNLLFPCCLELPVSLQPDLSIMALLRSKLFVGSVPFVFLWPCVVYTCALTIIRVLCIHPVVLPLNANHLVLKGFFG